MSPIPLTPLVLSGAVSIPQANLLDETIKNGLIPVSILAICSVFSTAALLSWLTYRLVWKHDYQTFVGYNQYVILIYNLLLADLQQSLSFIISLHWLRLGYIDSPSSVCFAQGWLIHIGDVASGVFVLAIALHTWYGVVLGRKLEYRVFTWAVLGLWVFSLLLTFLGPAIHGANFFVRAGAWCWADQKYDLERLWLHYFWIFVVEFGVIIIYSHIFLHLRKQLKSIRSVGQSTSAADSTTKLSQAARYMVLYPVIYVLLTLPLAAGRMSAMSGRHLPPIYYPIAGALMTSCGWLDSLLYTLTRRVFIKQETHTQTRASYGTALSRSQSRRKWLGSKPAQEPVPPLPTSDANWHLSTFASMDGKGTMLDSDTGSDDLILGRQTPSMAGATQTTIRGGDSGSIVVGHGIQVVSETTVEVTEVAEVSTEEIGWAQ